MGIPHNRQSVACTVKVFRPDYLYCWRIVLREPKLPHESRHWR